MWWRTRKRLEERLDSLEENVAQLGKIIFVLQETIGNQLQVGYPIYRVLKDLLNILELEYKYIKPETQEGWKLIKKETKNA